MEIFDFKSTLIVIFIFMDFKHRRIIFILLIYLSLIYISTAYGQERSTNRFASRLESLAREYYRIEDYNKALEGYLELDSLVPANTEYNYRIGICYLHSSFKAKAYPYLEFVYRQDDAPGDIFYELGQAYHYGLEFEKAIIFYESYKKQLEFSPDKEKNDSEIKRIDRQIQMCRNGQRLLRDPVINTEVVNLGSEINSPFTDFAPLINKNEDYIIFTSKRQATPATKSDPLTGQYYESIFYSGKVNNQWEPARYIGPPVHHDDLHDAAVGLSPDGNTLFLYQGGDNSFTARITGNLYVSHRKDNHWTEPEYFDGINSDGWESHASITEDGNTLIFTSNREGGMGGTDIYISRRNPEGHWGKPENIGAYINTIYDEDGPFIHPDGNKLYFSSKGHNSMGGYDIFYSEYLEDKGHWTRPKNLGYPINTADDDIYFVWSADGERAYFSSERENTYGNTDIYMLIRNDRHNDIIEVSGKVTDRFTSDPLKSEIMIRDLLSNNMIGIYDSDDKYGNYTMKLKSGRKYDVIIRSSGYQENITQLDLTGIHQNAVSRNFEIRKIR